MELKLKVSKLKEYFNILSSIKQSNTLPILEYTLIEVKDNKITYINTNLENTIKITDDYENEDIEFLIETQKIKQLLSNINSEEIIFDISKDKIEIIDAFDSYKFPINNISEFPINPKFDKEEIKTLTIQGTELRKALYKTINFTSNDDLRPIMTGILFKEEDSKINIVSTDAHALGKYVTDIEIDEGFNTVINKELAKTLLKTKYSDIFHFFSNEKYTVLSYDNVKIFSTNIEGKYPNYNSVIPKKENFKANPIIDKEDFINALKKVDISANKAAHTTLLTFKEDSFFINTENIDFGESSKVKLACNNIPEEKIIIGINNNILMTGLNTFNSDNIKLNIIDPTKAMVIEPVDSDEDYIFLIMPLMISNND